MCAISRQLRSGAQSSPAPEFVEVSGRSMLLAVEAHDGVRKIGEGTHRRGAVNLETFAKRLAAG